MFMVGLFEFDSGDNFYLCFKAIEYLPKPFRPFENENKRIETQLLKCTNLIFPKSALFLLLLVHRLAPL